MSSSVEMVKANLNGLDELIIPKHRADRPDWYTEQGWEKNRHAHMKDNIGKGDLVYYAGAEEGEFPALCAKWGAEVVMFEPNPAVLPNIQAIWKANNLPAAKLYEAFASNDNTGDLKDWRTPEQLDGEVIGTHGFKELYLEAQNYPQLKITSVANYLEHQPTAIIMDVEGSEFEVLKGAESVIDAVKPKIWLSLHPEFLFHQWGLYGREVRDWIINKGYKETILDYQHEVHIYYEAIK